MHIQTSGLMDRERFPAPPSRFASQRVIYNQTTRLPVNQIKSVSDYKHRVLQMSPEPFPYFYVITMKLNVKLMFAHRNKELLYDSDIASLPWLLFVVTHYFASDFYAITLAIVVWGICMVYYIKTKHDKIFLIRLKICGIVLLALTTCLILLPFSRFYIVLLAEVSLFFTLWLLFTFKANIRKKYVRKSSPEEVRETSVSLRELFLIAGAYMNALMLHFLISFLYFILLDEYHSPGKDNFIYNNLGIIFIFIVACFGYLRMHLIKEKLRRETWLPVVNETGHVIGKVAKSVSHYSGKQYLHPTVRIAVIYKGLLYITEKSTYDLQNPCKYDHPFEQHVYYNQTLLQTVDSLLQAIPGATPTPRPVFKYLYETDTKKRLIHLYILSIQTEKEMIPFKSLRGKTWTEKQIEENLGKNIYTECFEREYEFLKNTILAAEQIVKVSQTSGR
jgi:hypothetical protein